MTTHPVVVYLHVDVLAGGARHVEHHLAHLQHAARVARVTVQGEERSTHLGVEGVVDQLVVAGPVNEVLPVRYIAMIVMMIMMMIVRMPRLLMMMYPLTPV